MVHLEYRPRILETSNKNYIWWKLFRRIRCRICCRQFHPRQKINYLLYFRTHKKRWGCVVCFLFGWGNRLKIYSVYNNMIPTSKQLVWVDLPWDKSNGFGQRLFFGANFCHFPFVVGKEIKKKSGKIWGVLTQSQLFSIHVRLEIGYCQNTKRKPTKHLKSGTIVHIAPLESLTKPSCMMIQFSNKWTSIHWCTIHCMPVTTSVFQFLHFKRTFDPGSTFFLKFGKNFWFWFQNLLSFLFLIDPWVWFQFFTFQDSWFPLLPKKKILILTTST